MTTPKKITTRPLAVEPIPEFYALMDALDAWIKAARPTWRDGERALAALLGVVHYGDASCDCHRVLDEFNWPHRFEKGEGDGWRADYLCRVCGRSYWCAYAGLDVWLAIL